MIRLILKRSILDTTFEQYPDRADSFRTIDIECPELETALKSGGCGPNGFDQTQLVGIEVIP
jgi:hypothetical protein